MKTKKKKKHRLFNSFISILILGTIIVVLIVEYKEKQISNKQNKYILQRISYENIDFIYNPKENNQIYSEDNYNQINYNETNYNEVIYNEVNSTEIENKTIENKIVEKYKGYAVSAKLIIPKIGLETFVLKKFSSDALNMSVTKFWGPDANEVR